MFNLKELKIRTSYTGTLATQEEKIHNFVGIKRNVVTNQLEFCMPKGFDAFPKDSFDSIKRIFFRTYKTYRKFFNEKKELSDSKSFDGFGEFEDGYTLTGKGDTFATYSKLSVFDSVLDAYNELQILSLQSRLAKGSEINYSRIEKYLHRGVYLEDDAVFIDEMEIPKKVIDLDSPTLVQMFCYIYCEIQNALEENIESFRTKSLAQNFKEKFLSQYSSIFDEETFEETLTILKDTLDDIDRFTGYKDEDYWHFYDAIYAFLYGENEYPNSPDGIVWGLDNFAFIWEELCYHFASTDEFKLDRILFADKFGKFNVSNDFKNPFTIQINGQHKRYLRPDLVVTDNVLTDLDHSDFLEVLKKIFQVDEVELHLGFNNYVNLKLTPLSPKFSFQDLWDIYNKWVDKNPSVQKNPGRTHYRNVADQHRDQFMEEVKLYFTGLKTHQLINRKPLLFNFLIVDYKYVAEELFQSATLIPERLQDIKKQMVYEMALQSGYETTATRSEFWIPTYSEDPDDIYEDVENLNPILTNNGITVLKLNFDYLQEIYLMQ